MPATTAECALLCAVSRALQPADGRARELSFLTPRRILGLLMMCGEKRFELQQKRVFAGRYGEDMTLAVARVGIRSRQRDFAFPRRIAGESACNDVELVFVQLGELFFLCVPLPDDLRAE